MSDYAPPPVEYLESIVGDPEASLNRQELARSILMFGTPSPRFELPRPATNPELVAAVMMIEGHLKAADLGENFGDHLSGALYFAREPEIRARRLDDGGPGDLRAAEIAEAMLRAGRAVAQRLGDANDVGMALHSLEVIPCPTCGRPLNPYHADIIGDPMAHAAS